MCTAQVTLTFRPTLSRLFAPLVPRPITWILRLCRQRYRCIRGPSLTNVCLSSGRFTSVIRSELQHCGFLADGRNDPREAFVESLLEKLASSTEPIIVYSSYEGSTLAQLANVLKQHCKAIKGLTTRLCDLLAIMREHVYYADFGGSYSIKDVGPVIAPNISYDDLDYVAEGGAAAWAFERIAAGQCDGEENILRRALEEYCQRDTLAMVEIHSRLEKIV